MDKADLYKLLDIDYDDLQDFLAKYRLFLNELNKKQKSLITRSTPTVEMALGYFDPDEVTEKDLIEAFREEGSKRVRPIICCVPHTGPGGGG